MSGSKIFPILIFYDNILCIAELFATTYCKLLMYGHVVAIGLDMYKRYQNTCRGSGMCKVDRKNKTPISGINFGKTNQLS